MAFEGTFRDSTLGRFRDSTLGRLSPVDNWDYEHHRRCVTASLVQGAYTLERVEQGYEVREPSWWNTFGFQLIEPPLRDDIDGSIFGAVYKYNSTSANPKIPRYVIAFRGTLLLPRSKCRDLKLDAKLIANTLEQDPRFVTAKRTVEQIISESGYLNVWLAGHSLGSAIALLVGKKLMMDSTNRISEFGILDPLPAYLFNPPFVSTTLEWIKKKKVKQVMHIARDVVVAGVACATSKTHQNDSFSKLDFWKPNLFVNRSDHICSGYIGYFEQRKTWKKIGAGTIGRHATQHTLLSSLGWRDSEPLHLLPSARLIISRSLQNAHKLEQWWSFNNDNYESKLHLFSELYEGQAPE